MKITFNHEEENIEKIIAECEIADKDVDYTDEEIRQIITSFAQHVQGFEIGVLVLFLNVLDGKDITKISQLLDSAINNLGFNKFTQFAGHLTEIIAKSVAENAEVEDEPEAIPDAPDAEPTN